MAKKVLPEFSFTTLLATNEVVLIKSFEKGGYYPYYDGAFKGKEEAARLNAELDITPAQAEAMRMGSLFGWGTKYADPETYDENGKIKR
jgi:hypothetical protein